MENTVTIRLNTLQLDTLKDALASYIVTCRTTDLKTIMTIAAELERDSVEDVADQTGAVLNGFVDRYGLALVKRWMALDMANGYDTKAAQALHHEYIRQYERVYMDALADPSRSPLSTGKGGAS